MTTKLPSPRCPRCGYDLRGVAAAWTDACPLDGTCAECGLAFEWGELLDPNRAVPPWCVEFTRGGRTLLRAAANTAWRSINPRRFWSELKMTHPVRGRRLALYAILLFAPLLASYAAVQVTVATVVRHRYPRLLASEHRQEVAERRDRLAYMDALAAGAPEAAVARARAAVDPWYVDRLSRMDARERTLVRAETAASLATLLTTGAPTLRWSYPEAIMEALFLPAADRSRGVVVDRFFTQSYVSPATLHVVAFSEKPTWAWSRNAYDFGEWLELLGPPLGLMAALTALMPASFALLPASRRRAKVRWAHARVGGYSIGPLAAVIYGTTAAAIVTVARGTTQPSLALVLPMFFVGILLWAGLVAWWGAASAAISAWRTPGPPPSSSAR